MTPSGVIIELTPIVRYSWDSLLKTLSRRHPLRKARVLLRRIQDCTFEGPDTVCVVQYEPFTYFLFRTESRHDALPFLEGLGTYQIDTRLLPGADEATYPIEAGLYELLVNGEPAYDRRKGRFHDLVTLE